MFVGFLTKFTKTAIQYNFSLEWGEIGEIENRLMFNINEDQENYHKIFVLLFMIVKLLN